MSQIGQVVNVLELGICSKVGHELYITEGPQDFKNEGQMLGILFIKASVVNWEICEAITNQLT